MTGLDYIYQCDYVRSLKFEQFKIILITHITVEYELKKIINFFSVKL